MTADPYLWPGTECLKNKLGITDAAKLTQIEFRIVSLQDALLTRQTLPGEYDVDHYKEFHQRLFGDIYDWAGQSRVIGISKGISFALAPFVDEQLSTVLGTLRAENVFLGYARPYFLERLAYFYGELNTVHPFREGNGRTLRAFLRQAAASAGFRLEWSQLDPEKNIDACYHNLRTTETDQLRELLDPIITQM